MSIPTRVGLVIPAVGKITLILSVICILVWFTLDSSSRTIEPGPLAAVYALFAATGVSISMIRLPDTLMGTHLLYDPLIMGVVDMAVGAIVVYGSLFAALNWMRAEGIGETYTYLVFGLVVVGFLAVAIAGYASGLRAGQISVAKRRERGGDQT